MKTTFVDCGVRGSRKTRLLVVAALTVLPFVTAARAAEPPASGGVVAPASGGVVAPASVPTPSAFTEAALLATPPPGPYKIVVSLPSSGAEKGVAAPPQIATVFWYPFDDTTGSGFRYGDGTSVISLHPAQMTGYSYKNAGWYKRELTAMNQAGVDIVLCDFWGNPADRVLKPGEGLRWSFDGLGPLTQAATQLAKTERRVPKIGLYFDVGSLKENAAHYQPDLATSDGRAWLYVSLRDFFSLVPPKLRATGPNGGPVVFMPYIAQMVKNGTKNAGLWEYLRAHFANDFGVEPYFVLQDAWQTGKGSGADAVYSHVSILEQGLSQTADVAALGPGIDLRVDPRNPYAANAMFRDRENGAFYEKQWRRLVAQNPATRPRLVFVESWNQWQQATAIAPSREYGSKYVRLTRTWADLFHTGKRSPLPLTPLSTINRVSWFAASAPGSAASGSGLRLVDAPDGPFVLSKTAQGGAYVEARDNPYGSQAHLYFDVDDKFVYDADDSNTAPLTLTFEYWDEGRDVLRIQYDATEQAQSKRSGDPLGYTIAAELLRTNTRTWKTATVVLPRPRFANRENGGADLRFQSVRGALLHLRWVTLRRGD